MASEADAPVRGEARAVTRAALRRLLGKRAHRLGWGLADQGVSSLTNFAVVLLAIRTVGSAQFGAFSLAYVTYGFVLSASRGLVTGPLQVRFSGTDLPTWRRAVAECTGTAAVAGLVSGIGVLAAALLLHGTAKVAFLALGLTLPGLLLQDSWRYAFFALGRGSQAFLNDTIWALALIPALGILRVTGHQEVFWFILAWGAAAAVAAAAGAWQAGVVPRLSHAWEWVRRTVTLGFATWWRACPSTEPPSCALTPSAIIVGLTAIGYLQAANTLMGPFMVIYLGMTLVTVPEAVRAMRRSLRHLRLFCLLAGVGLAVLCLAWGVMLLVALPRGLGELAAWPDLAAGLPAGAAADSFHHGRVHRLRGHLGPARPGRRTAEPARRAHRVRHLSSFALSRGLSPTEYRGRCGASPSEHGLARWCGGGSCAPRYGSPDIAFRRITAA